MGLKIGILVSIACVLLLWATFQSGSFRLGKEEDIVVRFPSVGGLEEGATVRLNGVPVGIVRDISLTPKENEVAVKLGVKRGTKARLHQGSSARITTVGFLAELYVELSGGDETAPLIVSDAEIAPGLIADPAAMMNKVKTMADTLDLMLSNLSTTSRSIAQGKGTLGRLTQDDRLYEHMVSLTREATSLTARMNENQEKVSARLISLTGTLDSLTYQMQHGNNTVSRLLTSDELHQKLTSSTARLDSILAVVESGKGTFGRMMADTALFDDTKALVASMKRLMAEIEKNPKKYLKFSVF
jgi:phospholipid/cholesterol/gamma-HCH transport system substrate-binding protein